MTNRYEIPRLAPFKWRNDVNPFIEIWDTGKKFKPWLGGDDAPADWDGGRVLFRDGTLSVEAPQWVWRWKQPPYFRDIIAYTPVATTPSPDAPTT